MLFWVLAGHIHVSKKMKITDLERKKNAKTMAATWPWHGRTRTTSRHPPVYVLVGDVDYHLYKQYATPRSMGMCYIGSMDAPASFGTF